MGKKTSKSQITYTSPAPFVLKIQVQVSTLFRETSLGLALCVCLKVMSILLRMGKKEYSRQGPALSVVSI